MKLVWRNRFAAERDPPATAAIALAPPSAELSPRTPVCNPPPGGGGGRKGKKKSSGWSSERRRGWERRPETTPLQPFGQQQTAPLWSSAQPSVFQTPQDLTMASPSCLLPFPSPLPPPPPPLQQQSVFQTPQDVTMASPSCPPPLPFTSPLPLPPPPPPLQQPLLFMKDKAPADYSTKFGHLHPESQSLLIQIEHHILEQRDLSEELDQCSLLHGSSVTYDRFVLDSKRIQQALEEMTIALEREKYTMEDLADTNREMLVTSEVVIRSYMILRPRFLRLYTCQNTGSTGVSRQTRNPNPKRPSMFLENTVARFETYLSEYCQWTEKAERLIIMNTKKTSSNSLKAVPVILKNVHDYFIHVAAKVENLHQYVESMKKGYLAHHSR